ncbi:MAG TPA: glutamine amidotransferase, partial [Thermodesulfobacteriota bacterium]
GAFAMFGGRTSFDLGGYAGTPIEPLLPVTLAAPGGDRYDPAPRPVALTEAGRRHPLMQVAASGERNEAIWRAMPALDGVNVLGRPKPDAVVLATAPRDGGGGTPLIAVGRHGKGRTLAFASDAFWRWNFESVGRGQANRHYLRFVSQMVRWLIDDPLFAPLSVWLDKEVYQPGDEARVVVRALNDDFSPAPDANVTLRVTGPGGASQAVSVRPGDHPGEFVASVKPGEVGLYTVRAEARTGRRGAAAGGEGRGGGDAQLGAGAGAATARPPARAEASFRLAPSRSSSRTRRPARATSRRSRRSAGGGSSRSPRRGASPPRTSSRPFPSGPSTG